MKTFLVCHAPCSGCFSAIIFGMCNPLVLFAEVLFNHDIFLTPGKGFIETFCIDVPWLYCRDKDAPTVYCTVRLLSFTLGDESADFQGRPLVAVDDI